MEAGREAGRGGGRHPLAEGGPAGERRGPRGGLRRPGEDASGRTLPHPHADEPGGVPEGAIPPAGDRRLRRGPAARRLPRRPSRRGRGGRAASPGRCEGPGRRGLEAGAVRAAGDGRAGLRARGRPLGPERAAGWQGGHVPAVRRPACDGYPGVPRSGPGGRPGRGPRAPAERAPGPAGGGAPPAAGSGPAGTSPLRPPHEPGQEVRTARTR